jgi:hypothetical protein
MIVGGSFEIVSTIWLVTTLLGFLLLSPLSPFLLKGWNLFEGGGCGGHGHLPKLNPAKRERKRDQFRALAMNQKGNEVEEEKVMKIAALHAERKDGDGKKRWKRLTSARDNRSK